MMPPYDMPAGEGEPRAREALDVFVGSIRHYLGAYLVALGGADGIFFTGGIGENSALIRAEVCRGLEWAGIQLDTQANGNAKGEAPIHAGSSKVQLWILPTNEEIVVARQARDLLAGVTSA